MQVVTNQHDVCGECPVWDAESQVLYWTDCAGLRLHRYHSQIGQYQLLREGFEINGFRLDSRGGFTVVNNSGIWGWDGKQEPHLLVSEAEGIKCRMNDCTADPKGRLLAGSWFYNPASEYPPGHLIVVDKNLKATILDTGFRLANGIALSPDFSTLYIADSATRTIYAYDYNISNASVRRKRVLVQLSMDEGLPDGITVDRDGHLWVALWYGSSVVRFDPDGVMQQRISVPAKQVSSVAFGGPDFSELFITTAERSEPMPIMPKGYDPKAGYFGGPLFKTEPGVCGMAQLRTQFAA